LISRIISNMWIPFLHGSSVDRFLELFHFQMESEKILSLGGEALFAVLIVTAFWGISRFVRYVLIHWGPRIVRFSKTDLDDRILARVTPPVELLVLFVGVYLAMRSLPLPEKMQRISSGAVYIINAILFANIAYRSVDEFLSWYARRVEERTGSAMGNQVLPLVRKVSTIFLVCAALIVILKHFNYDILSLVTALGIGSLAIGLAAKDTLANMISGFTLMIDRPFRIGDRIQLMSGKSGDVVDIGLRSTRIRTPENTLLIIPNAELCNSTVHNMAFPDLRSQGKITIGVAYGSDVEVVKKALLEATQGEPDLLAEPAPEAYFLAFGDNALMMTLVFWVTDYTKLFTVTDNLNVRILSCFERNGIQIPYPTRRVLLEREE